MKSLASALLALTLMSCNEAGSPATTVGAEPASLSVTIGRPEILYGQYTSVPVTITNHGSDVVGIASAECSFYSTDGQLIASGSAMVMDLAARATGSDTITVHYAKPMKANCKAREVG